MGRSSARVMTLQDVLLAVGEHADDLQPERVADGAHDRREVERVGGRVQDLLSRARGSHARHGTTSIVPNHWKYGRNHGHHTHTRRPRLAPPPPALAVARLRARGVRRGSGAVRVGHAVAALRDLPRALGLLPARPHARLRHVRVRRAREPAPRRPPVRRGRPPAGPARRARRPDGDQRRLHARRLGRLAVRGARAAGARDGPRARRRERRDARPAPAPRPGGRRPRERRGERRRARARHARVLHRGRAAAGAARAPVRRAASRCSRSPSSGRWRCPSRSARAGGCG